MNRKGRQLIKQLEIAPSVFNKDRGTQQVAAPALRKRRNQQASKTTIGKKDGKPIGMIQVWRDNVQG